MRQLVVSKKVVNVVKVVVKNKNGEIMRVDSDDYRYLSGELKPLWYNKKHNF